MAMKKKKTSTLCFWIPFCGQNPKKLGTRIDLNLADDIYSVSDFPERRQTGDKKINNSSPGLEQVYNELSHGVTGYEDRQVLFFNICHQLLISHQRHQRRLV